MYILFFLLQSKHSEACFATSNCVWL